MREKFFGDNLYGILGIEHLGIAARSSDIKKAYRKLCLKHHPDKLS